MNCGTIANANRTVISMISSRRKGKSMNGIRQNSTAIKLMNLFKKTISVSPEDPLAIYGHLFLRVSAGLMVFYVHGFHKLESWIDYLQHGTPWKLFEEVNGMHFPAPYESAIAATLVQFICSLFVVLGWFTRINAALVVGALSGAILQNLLAGRDPQLAILYTLVMITLVFIGGGKYSFDARMALKANPLP
jgi:putative oxidoreductase